jgi:uncharacterized phage-associated protein
VDNENEEEVIGMLNHQDAVFNYDLEVEDVAKTFVQLDALREDADVTPMKLQKLLYLAQANYLASTGRRLFNEPVEAYKHGPVVYRAWKMFPGNQIIATQDASSYSDASALPEDVEAFIGQVWERYKDLSAAALRRLTHHQEPWTRNYVEDAYRPEIPDADMVEFFRDKVPAKDRVFHSAVVMVPEGFVEAADENEDEIVLRLSRLFEK